MILPIYAYGQPVLKKVATDIDSSYPNLTTLLENMWQTMYNAHGVGLAAPQIGLDIRLFIVDTIQTMDEDKASDGIKTVFINARILQESGEEWAYEEGCLSIQFVRGDVMRQPNITIEYYDENFTKHTKSFDGLNARVIQHEYDHLDGIMFTDRISPLRKRMIKGKLSNMEKGKVSCNYRVKTV